MKLFRDKELESEVALLKKRIESLEESLNKAEERQSAKEIMARFNEIYSALKMERVTEPGVEPKTLLKKKQ